MKTALAITTYFCEDTDKDRFIIFKRSIESLLSSDYPGRIFLVDDGSPCNSPLYSLRDIDTKGKITTVLRAHGGIARAKNTCIRLLLEEGIDVGFLADDDMLYKDARWYLMYAEAVEKTGIDHFSYYNDDKSGDVLEIGGCQVRKTPMVNGCFLTITEKLINKIGYFKILPYDYGHEHSNFSLRAERLAGQGGFFDIVDPRKYLELIPESVTSKSIGSVKEEEMSANEKSAILSEFKYEYCEV